METNNQSFVARIKGFVRKLVSPIPITQKKHLVLNILWLLLAVACVVCGIVQIANYAKGSIPMIFLITAAATIIPFASTFFGILKRSYGGASSVGKIFSYETTSTTKVDSVDNVNVYRVRTQRENLGGFFGFVAGFFTFAMVGAAFAFVGVFPLVAKLVLVIKEIIRYLTNSDKSSNANTANVARAQSPAKPTASKTVATAPQPATNSTAANTTQQVTTSPAPINGAEAEKQEHDKYSRRASEFLKIKDYEQVDKCADAMLEIRPASGMAYYYKFMAEQKINTIAEIGTKHETLYSKYFELACQLLGKDDQATLLAQKERAAKFAQSTKFRVPYGVTELNWDNTYEHIQLRRNCEEIIVPGYVKKIDKLPGFPNLKKLIIEDGVEEIGDYAFNSMPDEDSEDDVNEDTFDMFDMLEEVIIPNSVKHIGKSAFCFAHSLKLITIGNGVEEIDDYAFAFSSIDAITIPKSVNKIGNSAFSSCENLKEIIIPGSVQYIGEAAFSSSGLESVVIENGVKIVDLAAFSHCHLKTVIVPESVKSAKSPFIESVCENVYLASTDQILDWASGCKNVFVNNQPLNSYVIPEEITNICGRFKNSEFLHKIVIHDRVSEINTATFKNCKNLKSIEISKNNSKYKSINNTIIAIETKTLLFCSNPKDIPADGSVEIIPTFLFGRTLNEVYGKKGEEPETILLPDGITKIGSYAFSYRKVKKISIPKSVKEIGASAFAYCPLEIIEVDPQNEHFYVSEGCLIEKESKCLIAKTRDGKIPTADGIKIIGDHSCQSHKDMQITLPEHIQKIGHYAFEFSDIRCVIVPKNIKSLSLDESFNNCKLLTSVYFENTNNWVDNEGNEVNVSDSAKMATMFKEKNIRIMQKEIFEVKAKETN